MTTCLITGGAGFIGSHLVELCLGRGYRTLVLDDLSTGKKENLPLGHPDLTLIEGDIRDRVLLREIREANPDLTYLFHLAAIASVTKSMEDPILTHEVNFQGTLFLLDTFRKSPLKKIVYASSAAVYGANPNLPLQEESLPKPQSLYGVDKLGGEHLLKVFNDSFHLPTVSCRFFNVFGERQDPSSPYSGVISLFFARAVERKKGSDSRITIFGDGKQTRDFIYVKDVASALLFLAESKNIRGDVFNIGYGRKITILDLARKVQETLGVDIDIRFEAPREGDVRHSLADVRKLEGAGFTFSHDFETGLRRLAEFLVAKAD